jgi:V8-like Glu-specific endopeptidase
VVLVGSSSAAALTYASDEGKPVGTWQEPDIARTPVAAVAQAPGATAAGASATTDPSASEATAPGSATASAPVTARSRTSNAVTESAAVTDDGRQRVGELLHVERLLGYLPGGPRTETFSYPGASYVKLHFDRMAMLPGDYVTVSNPSGTESYRYDAATGKAGRWAMSITGDTAVLEMHRVAGKAAGGVAGKAAGNVVGNLLSTLGVGVDQVAKGFTRQQLKEAPEDQLLAPGRTGKEESVCGTDTSKDAVCYKSSDPVAYTKSKAIARLLINGTELCTGWRVGPGNRMLTNNHCFTTSAEAYDTEVWFNYQCAQCGGYDVFQPTKVWGSQVLSTDHTYDYTLFSVGDFAAIQKFGYLTLDTARPAKGQELYVPQHPAGEPTRIAGSLGEKAGNCSVVDPGYTGYATGSDVSYLCDTEGGSSGSPVLSRRTNKVVALHHFGGCPNSGVRADLLAARLAKLL